ncbi:hypothetical protein OCU04_005238 [Sclerotinia nivalis]|uniref:Uncharacterized protein n=1 Tax=Sclerotinia nivalis TaxID=352851 RepID=A0A9X0ANQ1_9HELO|nr:hypothetical protein OCU04_005238 [Sclerotinia nivalis]
MAGMNNYELMALALEKRVPSKAMTEAVMISAAGNSNGAELMEILFEKHGGKIIITEAIIIAAIENRMWGVKIVEALLKEQKKNITITNEVIKALVKRNKAAITWSRIDDITIPLLEKRGADMRATEEIFRMMATKINFSKKALTLLIEKQGEKMKVTQEMVEIVAEEYPDDAILLAEMEEMCKM